MNTAVLKNQDLITERNLSIFETHIHLSSDRYIHDFEQVVSYEPNFYYLSLATSLKESYIVSEHSKQVKNVFASVGIHPLYLPKNLKVISDTIESLESLIEKNRENILAIGEIGLDFYRDSKEASYELQLAWLRAQLELAVKYGLSAVLHLRAANQEALLLLKEYSSLSLIIHSFDGTKAELHSFLSLSENAFISFSPLIFRDLERYRDLINLTPVTRILVESDAPYLCNNSSICRSIIRIISEFKKCSLSELMKTIFQNSLRAFKLNLTD